MEDIIDASYTHAKEFVNLGEHHDIYVQDNPLLLPDIFEDFWNMHLKTNKLDPDHVLTAPGVALEAALKKTKVKLDL